jgi:hypothetical protein
MRFIWIWEFYYSQSVLKDLEILMQQENGSKDLLFHS